MSNGVQRMFPRPEGEGHVRLNRVVSIMALPINGNKN
jgi:hypothetical protein